MPWIAHVQGMDRCLRPRTIEADPELKLRATERPDTIGSQPHSVAQCLPTVRTRTRIHIRTVTTTCRIVGPCVLDPWTRALADDRVAHVEGTEIAPRTGPDLE